MGDVLKQKWFVVDQMHLPPGCSPYIIAGHWDAHVGQMICDMPMDDDEESDEADLVAQGWAVAQHIVDLHNERLEQADRIAELETALQTQHDLYTNAVNELSKASTWHDYVGQPLDPNVEREWRWHNGVTWRYLIASFPARGIAATNVQYRPIPQLAGGEKQ